MHHRVNGCFVWFCFPPAYSLPIQFCMGIDLNVKRWRQRCLVIKSCLIIKPPPFSLGLFTRLQSAWMLVYSLINYKDHKGRVSRDHQPQQETLKQPFCHRKHPARLLQPVPWHWLGGSYGTGKMHPVIPEAVRSPEKENKGLLVARPGMVTPVIVNRGNLVAAWV